MKKLVILLIAIVGTSIFANAQTLPKPSPGTTIEQMVGATEIKLEYSRPGVKDRTIFGELVPFGKLWRFGANSATIITTEHSLFFNGKELKAGTYSMFVIPSKESWKVMFNSDTKASTDAYTAEKNVLTVDAKVSENSFTESLHIGIDKIRDESASIVALWEKTKVEIPFTVKTKENSVNNIEASIDDLASVYNNAANYYYGLKDNKMALKYVDQSIGTGENYRNLFMKGRIMNEMGKKKEATALVTKALKLAEENASAGYINFIKGTLEEMTKMSK